MTRTPMTQQDTHNPKGPLIFPRQTLSNPRLASFSRNASLQHTHIALNPSTSMLTAHTLARTLNPRMQGVP